MSKARKGKRAFVAIRRKDGEESWSFGEARWDMEHASFVCHYDDYGQATEREQEAGPVVGFMELWITEGATMMDELEPGGE